MDSHLAPTHLAASLESLRRSILVLGYGNPLRSDDGVGQQVAQAVAAWELPNVQAISIHQLTPEWAETLARSDWVIFVDAYPATADESVQVRVLTPAASNLTSGHWCQPQALLSITQALYGDHPQAWWVMVPGVSFELGDSLSPVATQGIQAALAAIERLIRPDLIRPGRIEPCMKLG